MGESVSGDHYAVVRNPRYYCAGEGLPYLDKVGFTYIKGFDLPFKDLQAGFVDAIGFISHADQGYFQAVQHLKDYTLINIGPQNGFEALFVNFHNTVLSSHQDLRQAMAVDQQAVINGPLYRFASQLCTDHPSALHPGGYGPYVLDCPLFDLVAANNLPDDNGWVKGADGVRAKVGQHLEFEYSTTRLSTDRHQARHPELSKRDLLWPLPAPEEGLTAHGSGSRQYDIAEVEEDLSYDPDDSWLFVCNQSPSAVNSLGGGNLTFYFNSALDKLFAQEQATGEPGMR